jgi:dGTPase
MIKNSSIREKLEEDEGVFLAPYSLKNKNSVGRNTPEKKDDFRLDFARDRDRIIHTKAFRRLKGKTQVFVAHHGDHFRSRLTHSLEVAQIARTFARIFRVNEDVVEAVALAHDLGHTPFGHAGQDILNAKMNPFGERFEHNAQSRRILEILEPQNLCQETLLCLFKHPTAQEKKELEKKVGKIFPQNFLEAQIVDASDEIAYLCADLQDGLRSGIVEKSDFDFVPENFIDVLVKDLATQTLKNIAEKKERLTSAESIRSLSDPILQYSPSIYAIKVQLKKMLFQKMYTHPIVLEQTQKGEKIISEIFDFFLEHPQKLQDFYSPAQTPSEKPEIFIKDFIAGMTDSFATIFWEEHVKKRIKNV